MQTAAVYTYTLFLILLSSRHTHWSFTYFLVICQMVEADDYLGGNPVQHRQVQGCESPKFQGYFESLRYLDGGVASGFNHVEPTVETPLLFRVKSTGKQILMTQVPLEKSSLNEGDSFILYGDKANVWCWNGKDVSR